MNAAVSGFEDYLEFLQSLGARTGEQFLIGGQAVNFWAEYFDHQGRPDELRALRPFTSRDCDIWVSPKAWRELQNAASARLVSGISPADGQLGILTLSESPPRVVDFMSGVCGFRHDEHGRLCQRAPVFSGVKVIDPIFLFRSKCHCLLDLDQTDRQDARHVKMLSLILPEYLSSLIDNVLNAKSSEANLPPGGGLSFEGPEQFSERDILKEIKLLKKILSTNTCRRALEQLEINSDTLIPWSRMKASGLEALAAFARTQRDPGPHTSKSAGR